MNTGKAGSSLILTRVWWNGPFMWEMHHGLLFFHCHVWFLRWTWVQWPQSMRRQSQPHPVDHSSHPTINPPYPVLNMWYHLHYIHHGEGRFMWMGLFSHPNGHWSRSPGEASERVGCPAKPNESRKFLERSGTLCDSAEAWKMLFLLMSLPMGSGRSSDIPWYSWILRSQSLWFFFGGRGFPRVLINLMASFFHCAWAWIVQCPGHVLCERLGLLWHGSGPWFLSPWEPILGTDFWLADVCQTDHVGHFRSF